MAKRDYQNNYPSVTQVLGILRKPGLENWFKYNTAQFCNEESRRGKEIGSAIHEAIQSHIEAKEVRVETQYGEEVMNALKGFMAFKQANPTIILKRAEIVLTSEEYEFNGTMDVDAAIGDYVVVGDWKSGKCKEKDKPPIYDEHIVQLAAYFKAFIEVKKINVQEAFIAVFAKDKVAYNYRLITKQEIDDAFNEVFLPALRIYNYQKGR